MFNGYRRTIAVVGAAVMLTGGVLATRVLAETPTPGATTTTTTTTASATTGNTATGSQTKANAKANHGQVLLGKLAAALGIDQSKLQGAISQAASDTADEAVKNGDLTQKKADQLKSRIQQGGASLFGGFGAFGRGHFGNGNGHPQAGGAGMAVEGQAVMKAVADKLGMSVQDFQNELRAGKSLSDVAKEKGVSDQDLRAAVVNAVEPQLDTAVANGKLTQQQKDSILQRIQQGQWPVFQGKGRGNHQPKPHTPSRPQS